MADINLKKKNYLKIDTNVPHFADAVESALRNRFPEAEITKGKNGDTFLLKKNWLDRLRIMTDENLQMEENYIKVNFDDPVKGGCLFALLGFWPNIVQRFVSQRFKNEVIDELGRDLGSRYKAKAEYVEGWVNSALGLFFLLGGLIVALFFLFEETFTYFDGFLSCGRWLANDEVTLVEAFMYPFVTWLCFVVMWFRRRWIDKKAYIILPVTCLLGWLLFCCAHNVENPYGYAWRYSQRSFNSVRHYVVRQDSSGQYQLIDENTNEPYYSSPSKFDFKVFLQFDDLSQLILISESGKCGIINEDIGGDVIIPIEYKEIELAGDFYLLAKKDNGQEILFGPDGKKLPLLVKLEYKTGIVTIGLHVIAYLLLIATCYLFYRLSEGQDRRGQQSRIIYMP